MRNLRKFTAVVIAIALVLTSMATAFAAEATATTVVNGDKAAILKSLNLYAGKDVNDPTVGLADALEVQQALVYLANIFGYKADADKLTDEEADAALAKFADAGKIASYAKNVVAYAAKNGIIAGVEDKDGKLYVKPTATVTAARFATFILNGLGYDVTDWKASVAQLAEVDGSKIDSAAAGDLSRDAVVGILYGILTAKTEAGKTVAENLLAADSSLQAVLAKNSLLPVNTTLNVDTVVAVANNKVAVTLKDAATATAADFAIVKKGTTTAVAVKDAVKESDKVYILETDALTGGASYTITVNGVTTNFTGIAADTSAPTVKTVSAKDTNKFEVVFSDRMDFASVTDVANYTFTNNVKVVSVSLDSDKTKVTLTTDAAKKNFSYNITIQNVKNSDGKALATKVTRTVTATEDKTAPQLQSLLRQNNRMVIVEFRDDHGMNKEALETVSNYSINDLGIKAAKAYDTNSDGKYIRVVLTTDNQESNKSYNLTMENLTDNSVLKNPLGKITRNFRGVPADVTAPTVNTSKTILSYNNNEVEIFFNDTNAMDVASIEDISNYQIKDDKGNVLEVISAKAMATEYPDAYKEGTRGVTLTTAQQAVNPKINYNVEIKGVQDEFGNALKALTGSTYQKYKFQSSTVDTTAPFVKEVKNVDLNTVKLTFDGALKKEFAIDPTNYVIDGDLGSAIKAEYDAGTKVVTLKTQTMSGNKKYTITMNNIEDKYGNQVSDAKASFIATSDTLDTSAPSINYVYAMNNKEVHISLSEAVKTAAGNYPATITIAAVDGTGAFVAGSAKVLSYAGLLDDQSTVVYNSASSLVFQNYPNYQILSTNDGNFFTDGASNKTKAINKTLSSAADGYTFSISDIANDRPTIDYIEQIDGKTLRVTYTENVIPTGANAGRYSKDNGDDNDTHFIVWKYTNPTAFNGASITLAASDVKDLAGDAGLPTSTLKFDSTNKDSDKPIITGAFAEDNKTVWVQYSEALSAPGTYKVYYKDATDKAVTVFTGIGTVADDPNGNKAVKLVLQNGQALKSENWYYVEAVQGAADIAGNRAEVGGVKADFPGTDKTVAGFVTGVEINNATNVTVKAAGKNISNVSITAIDSSNNSLFLGSNTASSDSCPVALTAPVLSSVTYTATVTFADTTSQVYTFVGNTPDLGISLTTTAGGVYLNFSGFNTQEYGRYEVREVTAGAISTSTFATTVNGALTDALADDYVEFAVPGIAAGDDYYVLIYAKDDTSTVIYAARVTVVIP